MMTHPLTQASAWTQSRADSVDARFAAGLKRAALQLAQLNPTGSFEGYASLFGLEDLAGDIVVRGAFRDTLMQRGPRGIKLLWQHDHGQPIGHWAGMAEDARGLHVKGQLNLDVARAREVHSLMRRGSVDGLSIGYRAERSFKDKASGRRNLLKIDLREISVVTFPMLPQARVSAVKQGPGLAEREMRRGGAVRDALHVN